MGKFSMGIVVLSGVYLLVNVTEASADGILSKQAVSPRLPAAFQDAEALVDVARPEKVSTVEAQILLPEDNTVISSGQCAVEPGNAGPVTVSIPMTMPEAGRYNLEVCAAEFPDDALSHTLYVTPRELQFIWYGPTKKAEWATIVCNVSEPDEVAWWNRRGVTALRWVGGYCYRDKYDEDGFVSHWAPHLESHPNGISIDEFGNHDGGPTDLQMANALVRSHERAPGKTIVVWQAGLTPDEAAGPYLYAADWVIPECYMNYFNNNFFQFHLRISLMRQFGLAHKAVMGLSCTSNKIGTTAEGLEEQVRYVRRNAPEMPGLGFYKGYGSGEALIEVADDLCYEYFIKPTLLAERGPRKHGRVLIRNIGALTAHDIAYRFSEGENVEKGGIRRLQPARTVEVKPDHKRFEPGTKVEFVIEPAQAYSDVSEPVEVIVREPRDKPAD